MCEPGKLRRQIACAVLVLIAALPATAVTIPHGTVELVTENDAVRPGGSFYAGLKFQLEKDWHIYWINPGDAGQPPRVTWRLPPGITAGAIEWPYPKPLPAFSAMDFGYEGEVLLLIPMKADATLRPGGSADLAADLKLIVCRDVCIPGKAQLALSLPVKAKPSASPAKPLFEATRARLPRPAPAAWKFSFRDNKDSLLLAATVGRPVNKAAFFPLEESQIENAAPQKIEAWKTGFQMTLKKSNQLLKPIDRLRGVVLLGETAYVITAPVVRR